MSGHEKLNPNAKKSTAFILNALGGPAPVAELAPAQPEPEDVTPPEQRPINELPEADLQDLINAFQLKDNPPSSAG